MFDSSNRIIQTALCKSSLDSKPNKSYTNRIIQIVPCKTAIRKGSMENTGYQLGYPIGVPIWVLQKVSFIKVVDQADKSD